MTVAVGFFDGVHVGHQAILRGADAALTFSRHPLSVLAPEAAPRLLMTFESRVRAIRGAGVASVRVLDFTPEFAAQPPEAFAALLRASGADAVRAGANWRFGRGGAGDAEFLRSRGFDVAVVPYAGYGGAPVSSTRIRASLAAGDVESVAAMLGRPWSVSGIVFRGKGLGRVMGFPTVNLRIGDGLAVPPRGVYAVSAGGARGVANWGVAPTAGWRAWPESVLEIHFTGDVPHTAEGEPLEVDFLRYVRPERTFPSVDELRRQIARDVASCGGGT